ncbi:hypothetical protein C0Q70_16178 [Pomacea canaliculata]|uniref:ATP-dependent DNA helicase PIF1 n=2 Tax=Pomacea canaliculata TaxID=400727 RepID=A0A2T7NP22_POMCA|nr:ATP-dependent DNA helicase PIF1-like isoform X2 [Pomacea canaliculata]XP_025109918.1 ATP-dependent DNA helicase PIF1-like isoform X2 [Pomacea canaliculata]PVD22918.1 hypothetical protein C0Q70_16178 [Pomacea canaliculata]
MQNGSIVCSVSLEEVSGTGSIIKKTQHKNVTLTLGRDEFKELQLFLDLPKKVMHMCIREVVVHKKFMKDGKATIRLPDQRLQLLISNCPPDKLAVFLKTLQTKLEVLREKGFVSQRQRMLSEEPRAFTEISPLTIKDLQLAQTANRGRNEANTLSTTLSSGGVKRKFVPSEGQENLPAESAANKTTISKKQKVCNNISPSKIIVQPVKLNKEQMSVLEAVLRGRNIFFTGSAGTGKSFLLKRIIGALPPHHTYITASTGVAACHIGGTTLHAFAGIGSGKGDLTQCVELASRQQVAQHWRRCHHLIIDEISMVDGDYFEKLEAVARNVRKSDQPFGGIQLIVSGDFLQLPPVAKGSNKARFCFQTSAWHKCIQTTLELKEVHRQSDSHFIKVLQSVRLGLCPSYVTETLMKTSRNKVECNGLLATQLCTHKEDVESINQHKLKGLEGASRTFAATDSEMVYKQSLDKLCPASSTIELKCGAQVLLCKNLDVQRGLVNGARGIVTGFEPGVEGLPIVKFACGLHETIKLARWTFRMGGGLMVTRKQIPLKLAWAISIHKSQGMTLDCVEISLSKVFECGQAYVALSRAKSLEGLRVVGFTGDCVRANTDVLRFYTKLQLIQNSVEPREVKAKHENTVKFW